MQTSRHLPLLSPTKTANGEAAARTAYSSTVYTRSPSGGSIAQMLKRPHFPSSELGSHHQPASPSLQNLGIQISYLSLHVACR